MNSPIRWAGGKSWLVESLVPEIEQAKPKRYVEPFLGGGAIALNLASYIPKILSDNCSPLMDMWQCLRAAPKALIDELARVQREFPNTQEGYLNARVAFNSMILDARRVWVRRAALFLFINATCYNGLYRTNADGYFNVPWGKLASPAIIDIHEARELNAQLLNARLLVGDYRSVLQSQTLNHAAVFVDSPYDATFSDYTKESFNADDQRELAECLRWCVSQGARVWATNRDTPLIRELYSWAKIELIAERHQIGATGARRGMRDCVLIRG